MAFSPEQSAGVQGGIGVIGAVGNIFGTIEASNYARKVAQEEQMQAQLEMQADAQRRQAMEINARRQNLQTVRTAQQADKMALAAAVSQGGQFSSGLAGGRASVQGQSNTAQSGVLQNLQIGEKLFDINAEIDSSKIEESKLKSKQNDALGLGSIFGSIGKAAGSITDLMSLMAV